jgi:septal ring factor EnvC (AmiA/AmiB activator)
MASCRQENENISIESTLQILLKRIEDQDQKIATLETNTKNLERKNSLLEEMMRRSDVKQLRLEKTIEDLKTIISELVTRNVDTFKTSEEYTDMKHTAEPWEISEQSKNFNIKNDTQMEQIDFHGKPKQRSVRTYRAYAGRFDNI